MADAIAAGRDELVSLTRALVAFDTQAHPVDEPREEAALQAYLAERLAAAGLAVDLWEPDAAALGADRLRLGRDYHFRGRPQLLARRAGVTGGGGGGRSLLFNGHVDTVTVEPRALWSCDPHEGALRDGLLYGRGACDMKAGVAAMVFATEVLCDLGVELHGDLLVNAVTDEESTAAGTLASTLRGARADGAVVAEPTSLRAWLGTRGSLMPSITVHGRSGHAGLRQPPAADGGAVNAIEKAQLVLAAIDRLRAEWLARHEHPHLDAPDLVPVAIAAGEWIVTHPGSCTVRLHVQYLPGQADAEGWGSAVERELEAAVAATAAADPWLAGHPPEIAWTTEVPASYVAPSVPVAATTLQAAADLGLPGGVTSHTTWFDGATLVRDGTPAIAFGPGDIDRAHTVDEHVPVDELVAAAQVLAVTAMRFCGTG